MKQESSVVDVIRANPAPAFVALVALTAQVFHAYHVFLWIGHDQGSLGKINAALYAGSVELSVALFVFLGWAWVSWGFALASILVNVAYYTIAHSADNGWDYMFRLDSLFETWPMWIIAVVLPVAIASLSHATRSHVPVNRRGYAWSEGIQGLWARLSRSTATDTAAGLGPVTRDGLDLDTGSTVTDSDTPFRTELVTDMDTLDPDTGNNLGDMDTMVVTRPDPDPDTHVDMSMIAQDTRAALSRDPDPDDTVSMTLDQTDQDILSFLEAAGPSTKSEIAKAVNMSVGAMDRKKGGQRVGRLVRLSAAGYVTYDPIEGVWDVVRKIEWDTPAGVVWSTNGHG